MSESIAPESPDYFAEPVKGVGTKRVNWKAKAAVMAAIGLVIFGVAYTLYDRSLEMQYATAEDARIKKVAVAVPPVKKPDGPDVNYPVGTPAMPGQMRPSRHGGMPVVDEAAKQAAAKKAAELDEAMKASTEVQKSGANRPQAPVQPSEGERNEGQPEQKREFLNLDDGGSPYLKHTRMPALSPYELKAGSIIPGVMITGVNSELPGQIVGQVSQNVYSSAAGRRYLLIPAGSKTVGSYDSNIVAGQQRILVAWNRIIFQDGSSLSLDGMPGADQSGFAGFKEKVDNHYWRTFGHAAMLSLFSAGIQLSQPRGAVTGTYNSQQIMAAALGQQLGQLGMQIARRNLNIQPTLEISPGFQFSIMVTKDIILTPWQGKAD